MFGLDGSSLEQTRKGIFLFLVLCTQVKTYSMFVMLSLSVCTPGQLKSLLDHGGNRTRDLWFANPMLCQLTYDVKSQGS
jgi:hypothetical protein